jgi:hypothetical protein
MLQAEKAYGFDDAAKRLEEKRRNANETESIDRARRI